MAKVSTTLSIDSEVKGKVQALYAELGLDLSTAVNMFFRQCLYENGIPFAIRREPPNELTRAALAEGDAMLADPNTRRFHSVDELFDELEAE